MPKNYEYRLNKLERKSPSVDQETPVQLLRSLGLEKFIPPNPDGLTLLDMLVNQGDGLKVWQR